MTEKATIRKTYRITLLTLMFRSEGVTKSGDKRLTVKEQILLHVRFILVS